MKTPHLVTPSAHYAASYAAALREGLHLHTTPDDEINRIETDFDGWLTEQYDLTRPVIMSDGSHAKRVPFSNFWLVSGDDHVIGMVQVRNNISTPQLQAFGGHIGYAIRASERQKGYGDLILSLIRPYVRGIGIGRALITCRDDNAGSIRIIEKAGGVLDNKIKRWDGSLHRRYWLDV